ncbi:hypothetical protein [Thermogymnomonas acidicola]|uniref:hypothetical protein n=1 Tax=Thermogymnomonas acidicola TaxID=399579 RepID=UPI0009464E17|nr:hypothetical protein [Thermogymnomonas acidicola]
MTRGAVVERMLSLLRGGREVNFGFGLRSLEDVRKLVSGRDVGGVAIGTALIPYVREGDLEGFRKFVTELRGVLCDS